MKEVILKSLEMVNFKGEKSRKTTFDERETFIVGKNGIGKSRHFDAFTWLLFGKDAQDRKDYEIKTRLDNGDELHKAQVYVEGVLSIDGEDIVLRRELKEDWVKPRGRQDEVFKGNKTECSWNNAPVSVSEYNKRVKDIIDANVFKMLTNPTFFANMEWKLQREQLFQLAGTITDAEIAQGNRDYELLLERLSNKSIDDFKRERSATKKRLKNELDEIQPRIEQTQRLMPENDDFDKLKKEVAAIDEQIASIDAQIASVVEANKAKYEEEQAKQKRLFELKTRRAEIERQLDDEVASANRDISDRMIMLSGDISSLQAQLKQKSASLNFLLINYDDAKKQRDALQKEIYKIEKERDALRKQWFDVNSEEYKEEPTCPYCHQSLPDDMRAQAKAIWSANKQTRLDDINAQGKALSNTILLKEQELDAHERNIIEVEAIIEGDRQILNDMSEHLQDMQSRFAMGHDAPTRRRNEDVPEWVALTDEIAQLSSTIEPDDDGASTTSNPLFVKKRELNAKRDEYNRRIVNEKIIAKMSDELASLAQRGKDLAQKIADIEKDEYILQAFTRAKIDECEKRVNSLFNIVKFRLYDYTIDGNAVETCVATIDGVPYGSANTASRLNAGLDIINTLCRFYGMHAPIFLDNRESTLNILSTDSQIVNLVVTNDDELLIKKSL